MTPRVLLVLLAVAASIAAGAVAPATAGAAKKPCWQRVLDDWHDNGRIDGRYTVRCYRQAIAHIPEDERDYTSILDDISAAMNSRARTRPGSKAPGGGDAASDTSGKTGIPVVGKGPTDGTRGGTLPTRKAFAKVSAKLDGGSGNSLPLPLILLGALASVLLATAGGIRLFHYAQGRALRPAAARRG